MRVIYTRVSTEKQETKYQKEDLKSKYPDALVVEETASGVKQRPKLQELIATLNKGDVLIIAALDRLGRKTSEMLRLIEELDARGIILKSEREGVDYSTIHGRLVMQILCSVAQMERSVISERTKIALAARKEQGLKWGKPRKYDDSAVAQVHSLRKEGHTMDAIRKITGISKSRVHQLLSSSLKMSVTSS
jgi:DNA invertase Pin-like site-specific DNA recombinase